MQRPSARVLEFVLASLVLMPGCLLDPLALGPGDYADDGESGSADDEAGSSESSGSESDDGESTSSESDAGESSESDGESTSETTDTTDTTETEGGDDSCAPQGALPEDACETLLGFYWDGATCLALSGCSCGDECPPLFESPVDCWLANLGCGPSPCAGLDEPSCLADDLCAARYARPLALDIDTVCVAPPVYAGCGLATFCADSTNYACPILEPDAVHQFVSACLPEIDWLPCEPPQPEPLADCP